MTTRRSDDFPAHRRPRHRAGAPSGDAAPAGGPAALLGSVPEGMAVGVLPARLRAANGSPVPDTDWPSAAGRPGKRFPWALAAVLAVQAAISLSLIWSNSAFGDEANYLWVGHLELAHWFGGAPLPHFDVLSGAPLIYPPLGALANAIGGLAGARILGLFCMLGATVLLYSIASQLFGRRAAVIGSGLWAVSVSSLKLGAFATYDPMAVFLLCLSAWLVVQAARRRRAPELVILAVLALLIGDLTAYSYAIYDPAIIIFGFVIWRLQLGPRRARELLAWLLGALAVLALLIPTAMGLWSGIVAVTLTRSGSQAEAQGYVLTSQLAWEWSGLVATLGIAGAVASFAVRADRSLRPALVVLGASAVLVPVYQLHLQTGWSLDKHMACGIWLAAMSGGYLLAKIPIPPDRRVAAAAAGLAAFAFPLVSGWMSAYSDYKSWPDARPLVDVVRPLVAVPHRGGLFTGTRTNWILQYYTGTSGPGVQWGTGAQLPLNPARLPPRTAWPAFYAQQLELPQYQYRVIALQFPVGASAFGVAGGSHQLPSPASLAARLSELTYASPALAAQDAFAAVVEADRHYQLAGVVSYSDDLAPGSFLVWKRV